MVIVLAMLLVTNPKLRIEKIEPKQSKHTEERVSIAPSVVAKPRVRRKRNRSAQQNLPLYETLSTDRKEHMYGSAQNF